MKLQFKHQKFQADAAKAVCDVFKGQPYQESSYLIDRGRGQAQVTFTEDTDFTGWRNNPIIPELTKEIILTNLQKVQRQNNIKPSDKIEGKYNLTIEMETGVGKTYTYIKTMYELNKQYGWTKFIIVVPSIAIREGVYKTLELTQDHFSVDYKKKIRFFIYNSAKLDDIDRFASDNTINVMIINSQAFNSRAQAARRIYTEIEGFRYRKPIDIIAKTNPIIIIDEPQSVEGTQTKERLKEFNPLITLRYSATHKLDSIYNMVYQLDAVEAYNKKLVKRISVKGIMESGSTSTESYIYLESINLSKQAPTATIEFDYKGKNGVRKVTRKVSNGYNLYENSNELEEYKDGFIVKSISGLDNSIEFLNGIKLFAGDVTGNVSEDQLRRIQIRETILSHIEKERQLFYRGIKVLSLFFIDEVKKYKDYDEVNLNGQYAKMFEEEYQNILNSLQHSIGEDAYFEYLQQIDVQDTHAGYFSIDKSKKMVDGKIDRKSQTSDDIEAYDLIMKDKVRLLDLNPKKSPVRFLFSHSALREGWDNPNVFQICTLKQSSSDVRKRQEVGRGLRLCVNNLGERMDVNSIGNDVHIVNTLTVIASESYESFSKSLQNEIAEAVSDRPLVVSESLFIGKTIHNDLGEEIIIDEVIAKKIQYHLIIHQYIDEKGVLTDKYYQDKANDTIIVVKEYQDNASEIITIIDSIYDSRSIQPENARSNNVEVEINPDKLAMKEFKELWSKINTKTIYSVNFDTDELIGNAINSLNKNLKISEAFFKVETGTMKKIDSKEELIAGESFVKDSISKMNVAMQSNNQIKYDLIGKIVDETDLTRKAVVAILKGIDERIFNLFKVNPEEFVIKVSNLINDEKATAIIQHITYHALDDKYDTSLFTDTTIKGKLGINAMKANKHLFDHIIYDSNNEQTFAENLDKDNDVAVYVKLPDGFYISTPVGKYNPDWAIAFYEGTVKHIYFVAETKGSLSSMQMRLIENSKIECATKHFQAISTDQVKYKVVNSYDSLLNEVMGNDR